MVSLVAIGVRRLRIPYTVALVVVGLVLTSQQPLHLSLTPELILALLVPPLIFEAAFHINFAELERSLPGIILLAVPGVIIATLIVGGLLALVTPLGLPLALVFGALISATDPVSVVALFRALGVPKRLALLVEGESLFNDGTAIVIFNIVLVIALTGHFDPVAGIADFVRVAAGGTVVGLVLGWVTARVIGRIDDYLIETTLTTVLAFGSYLLAERLHFSGVLAVVAAGLVNGNIGPQGLSPTTRIVLFNFWEYVAFLANSFVFLLIGLQINIPTLIGSWQLVLAAILAVLVARAVVTYGLSWFTRWLPDPVPLRWLRIVTRDPPQIEYELRHARLMAFQSAATHLDQMHRDGFLSSHAWQSLRPALLNQVTDLGQAVSELLLANPALAAEELKDARRELLRAERGALMGLRRDGVITEEAFEKLVAEIDAAMTTDVAVTTTAVAASPRPDAQLGDGPAAG